jgi:Cu+-exporting ATPase
MEEEFYKKNSRRPEGLLSPRLAIVQPMLMASHPGRKHMTKDKVRATLVSVVALDGRDESAVLALAASLAPGLEAPLAAAILESARERNLHVRNVDRFDETTFAGAVAAVDGHTVILGNSTLLSELGLSVESFGEWPERLRQRGEHVLFLAVDGRTAGFFGVVDADV